MEWDAAATIIQAIATIVALVGVAVTFGLTSRGQRQDRELARQDAERAERAERAAQAGAERSERAAALTIDTLTRMAEALEGIAARGAGASIRYDAAPPARVSWALRHHLGSTYLVENTGTAVAHRVEVRGHSSLLVPEGWPPPQDVQPGEAITFVAVRTPNTSDSTITVTWSPSDAADAPPQSWRYPLPPPAT